MSTRKNNTERTFIWVNKHLHDSKIKHDDRIVFAISESDSEGGELSMRWQHLGKNYVPYLHIYNDSWHLISALTDLFDKLSEYRRENISPVKFISILKECEFQDKTEYEDVPDRTSKEQYIHEMECRLAVLDADLRILKQKLLLKAL